MTFAKIIFNMELSDLFTRFKLRRRTLCVCVYAIVAGQIRGIEKKVADDELEIRRKEVKYVE